MSEIATSLGIDRLSVADRLRLVQEIWDSIATEVAHSGLSEPEQRELDRRWAGHEANPEAAIPWEQVKAEALARLRR